MTRLHTYLNFAGNAEESFEFYRSVLGGELSSLSPGGVTDLWL